MSFIDKILGFVRSFSTRLGIEEFVARYTNVAVAVVNELAKVNNNADFLAWKDLAFRELKLITGETRDTWIAILVASVSHLTGAGTKPGNWFTKVFGAVWRFLSGNAPALTELLRKYGSTATDIVQRLQAVQNNSQFVDIERDAIAELRRLYGELSSSAAGLIINAVFEALKTQRPTARP